MSELRKTQEAFWSLLVAAQPLADDRSPPSCAHWLAQTVQSDRRASALARLQLYAGMYFERLLDNLVADFPRLHALLGAAAFRESIADYLQAHPSDRPSVRQLGRSYPRFVRERWPQQTWLADLAALEWKHVELFDCADEPCLTRLDLETSAASGFAGLMLRAIDAHACLRVHRDVPTLWREPEATSLSSAAQPDPIALLVWRRPDGSVHHRVSSSIEADLLADIQEARSFADLCAQLSVGRTDEAAARCALELLARWTSEGLLASL